MAITLILPTQALVLHAYAVLTGSTPGNAAFKEHQAFINTAGVGAAGYKAALESFASSISTASLATTMLANLGLSTAFTQAQAVAFLNANPGNRVGAMMDLASQLYNYNGTDATLLTAKAAYVTSVDGSYIYSNNTANINGQSFIGTGAQTVSLTTGLDNLVGSAVNDTFIATTVNGANTFQDGDKIDGGAGVDTVYLDFVSVGNAITPNLKNVETVVIRAQSASTDANGVSAEDGNNMPSDRTVQIDAQRSLATDAANKVTADIGVTQWESSNSRSDVIIEDVRIGNAQKTKDITIAFRESDPGNVDLGVYFDQHSLRNAGTGQTSLTINLMDSGAAAVAATAATPLLNNPYDLFKLGINGVLSSLQLDKVAVAAADTYEALLAVFNTALTGTGITAELLGTFTIIDPLSTLTVTGKSIVLKAGPGVTITAPAGSGWFNTTGASVPASSNIYTTYTTDATSTTELVTSKIILDDVGRGSTGGDLVVGGMSVGDTSTSRGVERFEISVEDSSKLQTINSTNNALREVVIVNGTTSNTSSAYNTVVTNAGDLTVNGKVTTGSDATLPGVETGSAVGTHDAGFGFSDVRLIDGSAMTGKLNFTSQITTDSLAKYVNLTDTASSPTADVAGAGNVNFNIKGANFLYTGGGNNDTMAVTIDSAVAASTTLTGQSDFSIVIDGGAGNDSITTDLLGSSGAWLIDQRQNANIRIEGGAGNDTITTTGAGDVIINAGAGNDTVFADNSGTINTKWLVNATNTDAADLSTAAATSTFMYGGKLTVSFSGAGSTGLGGGVTAGAADSVATNFTNGYEVVVDIPTGANFGVTQLHLNQAIKNAINNDAVLSKLLTAADGPAGTLIITSKIDGAFNANDLSMTVSTPTLTAAEEATALAALKSFAKDSSLVAGAAQTANNASVTTLNAINGMSTAGAILAGATAAVAEVQTIDFTGAFAAATIAAGNQFTVGGVTVTLAGTEANDTDIAALVVAALNPVAAGTVIGDATSSNVGALVTIAYTAAYGNVAPVVVTDGTASLAPAVLAVATTTPGITAVAGATGAISAVESDNTIDLGAGNDVVVLGTGALSNDKVVFTGSDIGTNAIVNFQDGAGANADKLDFKSYLTSLKSTSNTSISTESQVRMATTLNADVDVEANSVTVISGVTFSTTETFNGLNATNLLAAINSTNVAGAGDWGTAGLVVGTLDALDATYTSTAGANYLVGGIAKAIVMVENTGNEGEYKVFELTYNGVATGATAVDFTAATLLGTVDFGNQVTLLVGNLA